MDAQVKETLQKIKTYPYPVFMVWRDHVGKHYYSEKGTHPKSLLLSGLTQVVSENETDVIVSQFVAQDGGLVDQVAIVKDSIVEIFPVPDIKEYIIDE